MDTKEYNVRIKKGKKGSWPIKYHISVWVGTFFEPGYRNVLFNGTMTMWGAKKMIAKAIKRDKQPKVEFKYKIES